MAASQEADANTICGGDRWWSPLLLQLNWTVAMKLQFAQFFSPHICRVWGAEKQLRVKLGPRWICELLRHVEKAITTMAPSPHHHPDTSSSLADGSARNHLCSSANFLPAHNETNSFGGNAENSSEDPTVSPDRGRNRPKRKECRVTRRRRLKGR